MKVTSGASCVKPAVAVVHNMFVCRCFGERVHCFEMECFFLVGMFCKRQCG